MNKLFPVPMMGQGTADVESLPSYLSRCAFEHGVSVGTLVRWVEDLDRGTLPESQKPWRSIPKIATMARCNQYSCSLREALGKLTGQDLRCRPLEFLDRHTFSISREIGGISWCPECIKEQSRIGEPLYFKQLWHMRAVSHCHIHRARLLSHCAVCGQEQRLFSLSMPVGYCVKCKASLAERHAFSPDHIVPSWKSYSFDIVDVFIRTAKEVPQIDPSVQQKMLIRVFRDLDGAGIVIESWTDSLLAYFEESLHTRRLISHRRLAYILNISLYDLLTIGENYLPVPLMYEINEDIPEYLEKVARTHRDHAIVRKRLEAIAFNHEVPISLKELARMGEVSVGYIEYRFPDLAKQVTERHQRYQQRERLINRYRAQAAALRFFTDDHYSDHSRSRKEAYRVLREETKLPKWVLKNAIQTAYGALQLGA